MDERASISPRMNFNVIKLINLKKMNNINNNTQVRNNYVNVTSSDSDVGNNHATRRNEHPVASENSQTSTIEGSVQDIVMNQINEIIDRIANTSGGEAVIDVLGGLLSSEVAENAATLANWSNMSDSSRLQAGVELVASALGESGYLTTEDRTNIQAGLDALTVVTSPYASDTQKGLAIANALGEAFTTSFTGDLSSPHSIGGQRVVNTDDAGNFILENSDVVNPSELTTTSNVYNALSALHVLSSDAPTEDKIMNLAQLGINTAESNSLISSSTGSQMSSLLSAANTAMNWSDMDDVQRVASMAQLGEDAIAEFGGRACRWLCLKRDSRANICLPNLPGSR